MKTNFSSAASDQDEPTDPGEVHPLDKDYEAAERHKGRNRSAPLTLRWVGVACFAAGCVSLLPAAALATSFPATWLESLGSAIHRLGMIAILVGGILIIVAHRLD